MARADTFDEKFAQRLDDYAKNYNVEDLNDSNDRTLLYIMIRAELMLDGLQAKVAEIMEGNDVIEKASELKKLSDLIRDSANNVTTIQKTLGIDRKTRKTEDTNSVADYIVNIKRIAKSFLDERLIKIYCPDCKVLVARYSPVHDHTAYAVSTECSQCGKQVSAHRKERDIWFDVKDSGWRKKQQVSIEQPSARSGFTAEDFTAEIEDDVVIDIGQGRQ